MKSWHFGTERRKFCSDQLRTAHLVIHPRAWNAPSRISLPSGYVVVGLHLRWIVSGLVPVSRRFRNWSNLSNFQVRGVSAGREDRGQSFSRMMGTPSEENWPNIIYLPQFKSAFPKFKMQQQNLQQIMDRDPVAYDLLTVGFDPLNRTIDPSSPRRVFSPVIRRLVSLLVMLCITIISPVIIGMISMKIII